MELRAIEFDDEFVVGPDEVGLLAGDLVIEQRREPGRRGCRSTVSLTLAAVVLFNLIASRNALLLALSPICGARSSSVRDPELPPVSGAWLSA
jgi:hypothetical protein